MECDPPSQDSGLPSSSPDDRMCPMSAMDGPTPVKWPDMPPPLHPKTSSSSGVSTDPTEASSDGESPCMSPSKRRKVDPPEHRDHANFAARAPQASRPRCELDMGRSTDDPVAPSARSAGINGADGHSLLQRVPANRRTRRSNGDQPLLELSGKYVTFANMAGLANDVTDRQVERLGRAQGQKSTDDELSVRKQAASPSVGKRAVEMCNTTPQILPDHMQSALALGRERESVEDGFDETVQWEIDEIVDTEVDSSHGDRKWLVRWKSSNNVVASETTWLPIESFVSAGNYEIGVNAMLVRFETERMGTKPVVDWVYPVAEVPEGSTTAMPDGYQVYHVKPNETNSIIADTFELDFRSIENLNASRFGKLGIDRPYKDHTVIRLRKVGGPPQLRATASTTVPTSHCDEFEQAIPPDTPSVSLSRPSAVVDRVGTPSTSTRANKTTTPVENSRRGPGPATDPSLKRPSSGRMRRMSEPTCGATKLIHNPIKSRRTRRSNGGELLEGIGTDGWQTFDPSGYVSDAVPDVPVSPESPPPELPLQEDFSTPPEPPSSNIIPTSLVESYGEDFTPPLDQLSNDGSEQDSEQYSVEKVIGYRAARPANRQTGNPAEEAAWLVKWTGNAESTWEPIDSFIAGPEVTLEWEQYERDRTGQPPRVDWKYPDLEAGDRKVMADGFMVYCCHEDQTMREVASIFDLSLEKLIGLNLAKNPLLGKRVLVTDKTKFKECTTLRLYQFLDGYKGPQIKPPYPPSDPRSDAELVTSKASGAIEGPDTHYEIGRDSNLDLICGCTSKRYGTCPYPLAECRTHTKTQKAQVSRSADFEVVYQLSMLNVKRSRLDRKSDEPAVTILNVRRKQDGCDEYQVLQYINGSKKRSWEPERYLTDRDYPERGDALTKFKRSKRLPSSDQHLQTRWQRDVARPRILFDVSRNEQRIDEESDWVKKRQFTSMSETKQNRIQQTTASWMQSLDFNKFGQNDARRLVGSLHETVRGTVSRSSWITSFEDMKRRERRIAEHVEDSRDEFRRKLRDYAKDTKDAGESEMKDFRPLQLEIIMTCLKSDKDVLVHMPTGDGKSLPFQFLAACEERHMTMVVILPLKSLRDDQIGRITNRGRITAIALKPMTDFQKHDEVYHKLEKVAYYGDPCQIIFTTPEILQMSSKAQKLLKKLSSDKRVSRVVVDEAHVISMASKNYRPVYTDLLQQRDDLFPGVPILAMSAVGSQSVINDITASLGIRDHICFRGNFIKAQTNIAYHVWQKESGTSTDHVLRLLDETHGCNGSAIVYCIQKSDCKLVADTLAAAGISASAYHSEVPDEGKESIRLAWQDGSIRVVCATDSFGLGINNPNVRMIIHFSPPLNMSMYYQHCGRAGRDGQLADCILLYHRTDWGRARNVINQNERDTVSREKKYREFNEVIKYATQTGLCRQKSILIAAGIEPGMIPDAHRCNRCDFCQFEAHHARSARLDVTFAVNKLLAWLLARASTDHGCFTLSVLKKEFFGKNVLGSTLSLRNAEMEGLMEDLLLSLLSRGIIKFDKGYYGATSYDSLPQKTERVFIVGEHHKSELKSYNLKPGPVGVVCVAHRCGMSNNFMDNTHNHPIFGERFQVCNQCRSSVDRIAEVWNRRLNGSTETTVDGGSDTTDDSHSEMSVEFMEEEEQIGCCMCAGSSFSVTCTACPSTLCRRCVERYQGTMCGVLRTELLVPGISVSQKPRWFCPSCATKYGVTMVLPSDVELFKDAALFKVQSAGGSDVAASTSALAEGSDPNKCDAPEGQQSAGLVGPNHDWPFFVRASAEIAVVNGKLEWLAFTRDLDDALCSESESLRSKMKRLRYLIGKGSHVAIPWGGLQQLEDAQTWGLHLRAKVIEEDLKDSAGPNDAETSLIIQPVALELKKQKRFWLKYGRDRFLSVMLSADQYKHPRLRHLLSEPLLLFGRQWQLLVPRLRKMATELIFFAVADDPHRDGMPDLVQVSIAEVQDWHFPWKLNLDITVAKYISRFDLGFSDTTRTIEIDPAHFKKIPDTLNNDGIVMNDGCAGINPDLMRQIGEKLAVDAGILETLCPSAVQVRLGPVKGILYLDETVAGVAASDSMRKYELPLDDPVQRTVEVIKYSKRTAPAYLNRQGLRALEARGLTRDTLEKKSRAARANLLNCLDERAALVKLLGQAESRRETEVKERVQAGFAHGSVLVKSGILEIIQARYERKKGESNFPIEQARRVLIIADPTLTLEPNECYIHLSSAGMLMQKVVVFRNPCYHPGELLVLDAVHKNWDQRTMERLFAMKDVVVLSAKGPRPTADKMQGGDYDGDEVMVIYDKEIVSEINEDWESPMYHSIPARSNFVGNRKLKELALDESRQTLNETVIDTWLAMVKESSKLGEASNLYECWADIAAGSWKKPSGEFTNPAKNAQKLAEICFNQIDAEKTGAFMSIPSYLKVVDKPHYEKKSPTDKDRFRQSTSLVAVLDAETKHYQRKIAGMDAGPAVPDEDFLSVDGRTDEQASISMRYKEIKEQYVQIMLKYEDGELKETDKEEQMNAVTEEDEQEFMPNSEIDKRTKNARAAAWYVAMQDDYNKKRKFWCNMKKIAENNGEEFDQAAPRFPYWVYRICGDYIRNIKSEKCAEREGTVPIMTSRRL